MSWTDLKTFSEVSWLPFYDIKFIIFLLLVVLLFVILFFWLLKKLINKSENKELDMFFKSLDDLNLNDEERRIVKIFTVFYTKYNRYSYFLWFAIEDTLSVEDKEFIKSFENNLGTFSYFSGDFKNFKSQYGREYKIFKKLYCKIFFRNTWSNLIVIILLLLLLMALISVLFLVVPFSLK